MTVLLEIPGPCWYPHQLLGGLRQRWPANPRQVFMAWYQNLCFLRQQGVLVALVPPPVETPIVPGLPNDRLQWQDFAKRDPLLALAHLRQAPGDVLAVDVWPGGEFGDLKTRVVAANRSSYPAAPGLVSQTQGIWRSMLSDQVVFDLGAPVCSHLADEGWPSHLQIPGEAGRTAHLLAHQRAWAMPSMYLPRKAAPLQTRESHELLLGHLQVQPGSTVLTRMLWKAADGGARWFRDLACAGPGRALIHETAMADGLKVVAACEERVPGIRCQLVASRELSLRKAIEGKFFQGLLVPKEGGLTYIGSEAALSVGAKVLRIGSKSGWLKGVQSWPATWSGFRPVAMPALQEADLRPGYIAEAPLLARLEAWGQALPEEVTPKLLLEGPDPRGMLEDLAGLFT